jgi:fucose permease
VRVGGSEAVAFGSMFLFGIVVALLGAVLPLVSGPLGLDLEEMGDLFVVLNGAILVGSLVVGVVIDRFGYRGPLTLGPLVIGVALVLVWRSGTPLELAGAIALLGLAGSAMNAAPNSLVADLYADDKVKAAALNRLGIFFGFGALFLPLLIGALLGRLGLGALLLFSAGLCVVVSALATLPRLPPAKQPDGLRPGEALALLRHPLVVVLGTLLFFEAGNEMLVGGYLTTFLTRETGASVARASWVLAAYWVALMTGRLLLGRVLLRIPGAALMPAMGAGAAAAVALVPPAPGFWAKSALFVLSAFCLSGVVPTTLGVAGTALPARTGTLFGLLFALSVVGSMAVPWVGGQAAAAHGLGVIPVLGAGGYVAVMLLALWAHRLVRAGRGSGWPSASRFGPVAPAPLPRDPGGRR